MKSLSTYNSYFTVKNIRQLFFLYFVFVIVSGCEKFMHSEEISIGKIKDFNMLVSATEGVYGNLAFLMGQKYAYGANLKGDDINWYNANYSKYSGGYSSLNYSWDYAENIDWKPLYQTNISANNILNQFEPVLSQLE